MIKNAEYIFITDIGSTTTKGLLIKYDTRNNRYNFVAQADAYTTVEKPYEDVNIGVRNAVKNIENICSIRILDQHSRFLIPYLTTSSAGGGLQILVCGLTRVDTGKNAEITALGAGGIVLRTFTIDDGLKDFERIKVIIDLNPDMILVAGGYDGGSNTAILRFIQMMILARPRNRFDHDVKVPLIYCGDTNMQKYIKSMLPDHFIVSCTENIRPDFQTFNYEPAKQKIHEVFKDSVMEHAPGYSLLKQLTTTDIRPTPTAVEQMLKLYVEKHKENLIAIDMGGATTDIYSYIKGSFHRTVSANVGLSFSMANILASVLKDRSIKELTDYLPPSYTEDNIRNYINNKTLNPSYLPTSDPERYLEQMCAVLGFELSLSQHLEMNFNNLRNDFFDRIDSVFSFLTVEYWKKMLSRDEYCEECYNIDQHNKFYMSDIQTILGSGGVIAYANSREEQIYMLNEGLKPYGITKIVIDKPFKISHMGILSFADPENALEMFERECLETIAYVIAPTGRIKAKKPVIHLKENTSGRTFVLTGGQIIYSEGGGDFEITSTNGHIRVDRNLSTQRIKTDFPVLIDCRGRGKYFINNPLLKSDIKEFQFNYGTFVSNIPLNQIDCSKISYELREFTESLPHSGNILVQKGESVKAGDIIGKNESATQEYFYADINHLNDAKDNYSLSEMKERIKVRTGQFVHAGDVLFRGLSYFRGGQVPVETDFTAKRSGTVIDIYYDIGLIAFEVLEQNQKVEVEAAKFFLVKNKYIGMHLTVHEGEAVKEGQSIGLRMGTVVRDLKSPIKGIVKKIDKKNGTVVIENIVTPYLLKAFVSGKVKSVEDGKSVTVVAKCAVLNGATGFGGETYGEVYFIENIERFIANNKNNADSAMNLGGKILVFHNSINLEVLQTAAKLKVNGIIAPSIDNKDWVLFCKNELNVAFTGDEQFGFSLVLLKGFGNYRLEDDVSARLKSYQDKEISISGRTQIRAGIIRPQIILPALD
jgi:uncharacterized protein (TIGR01319 family)